MPGIPGAAGAAGAAWSPRPRSRPRWLWARRGQRPTRRRPSSGSCASTATCPGRPSTRCPTPFGQYGDWPGRRRHGVRRGGPRGAAAPRAPQPDPSGGRRSARGARAHADRADAERGAAAVRGAVSRGCVRGLDTNGAQILLNNVGMARPGGSGRQVTSTASTSGSARSRSVSLRAGG
jgi:hypothetical protein